MKQLLRNYITLIVAGAGAILLAITTAWLWSNHSIASLERESRDAVQRAETLQQHAARLETEAAGYKQKIDYLEQQLANIQQIARRQDEELTKLNSISNNARRDVARARRTRSAAATADELCQKLAELGYECE